MNNLFYTSFKQWRLSFRYRTVMLFNGIYGLIFHCLIVGLASLLYYVIRQVNAFFRRETVAGCIVASVILLMSAGWLNTFVVERRNYVEAQHKADSLAYNLSKVTEMYEARETLYIRQDTIITCK